MGKKHVIEENKEEAIKEQEKVDKAVGKEVKVKTTSAIQDGRVYVSSSYNNTILTLTNSKGQVLAWKSAGSVGFKGTKNQLRLPHPELQKQLPTLARKLELIRWKF